MNGDEHAAFKAFAETTNLASATAVFMSKYERPGVLALEERQEWARKALAAFKAAPAGPAAELAVGSLVERLRAQIKAGKIIFDNPSLQSQLLRLNVGTKVTPKLQALVLKLCDLTPVIRISSLVRSGGGSFHALGQAVDIGNQEIAGALLPQIATPQQVAALGIDELIFDARLINRDNDANKFNFNEGARFSFNAATINGHGNHIHFAVTA